ncbi:MAG: MFS transporter [Bacillota bacterium]
MLSRNARYNILNAVTQAVGGNMIQPYVGILAVKLGADNLQLGYLSSWPNLVSVAAVLWVASAVARARQKQRLIAAVFLAGRMAALGAAAVPWLPEGWRVWALIIFWTLYVFPTAAAGTALQSFLADVFPASERGKVFAARQSWASGAGMVMVLLTGYLLDHLFPQPLGYQIMFAGSFLVALVEIFFFLRLREPEVQEGAVAQVAAAAESGGWGSYLRVFRHKPFVQFLLCSVPFHFTWQMAWPLFTRYQVSVLEISNTQLSMVQVANALVAVLTYPLWARWAERRGNKIMMFQAALHLATAPVLTSLVPSAGWLVAVNLFTGIGVAGVMLLILNNLLEVSPNEGRPVYLAVHSALTMVSATVAPMAGAFLLESMPVREGLMLSSGLRLLPALFFYIWFLRTSPGKGNVGGAAKDS